MPDEMKPHEVQPEIQPLSYTHRRHTFRFLLLLFVGVIPFLYLYATGYRFEFGKATTLVSTGGIYVAAEKADASIYVDEELMRETRSFRRAFYAQSLEPGTHRVHVQKAGHHTWVKELPVYEHLVTEAQAFNLPIVPQVRIISPWRDQAGRSILFASSTLIASTTNTARVPTSTATTSLIADTEFASLVQLFSTSSATTTETITERLAHQIDTLFTATTTATSTKEAATTTKEWRGVRIFADSGDVYASWTGSRDDMPYYYCAEDFELLGTSTIPFSGPSELELEANTAELIHPVQTIPEDAICDPVVKLDRRFQEVTSFDFFPGSTDHVILALEDGVYVVEIDDRAWQNVQPLLLGENLDMRVENGNVYVYDGTLIYHVLIDE